MKKSIALVALACGVTNAFAQDLTSKNTNYDIIQNELQNDLKLYFRPEFLNRLDDIIIFNPLWEEQILTIVDLVLKDISKLLANKKIKAEFSEKLKKHLSSIGYDRDFWARPLKRAINNKVVNFLSNKILSGELISGDDIFVDLDENKEVKIEKK